MNRSVDEPKADPEATSRRGFLGFGAALAALGTTGEIPLAAAEGMKATMTEVSKDTVTDAGEPILYLDTPNPEISSSIMTIPPGTTTEWMTHPVQGYVYVLEGTLIVEFADGMCKTFKAGQGFLQARTKWHRGRNDGERVVRFLAVFFGGKGVPNVLHPPKTS
ncbi:cupin domain-containing protein [Singulisphaera sp. PoT]|uniref:cupin domain-containing protein n=1 Tax=Singulisphaera sp. PoT TaxID=3411797 RepID=UPI003BF595BD